MADIILNTTTDIALVPLKGVYFYKAGDSLVIGDLEQESSMSITSKRRNHYQGGEITLGYFIDITIYVPENKYTGTGLIERLDEYIEDLRTGNTLDIQLAAGNTKISLFTSLKDNINYTDNLWIELDHNCKLNYDIDSLNYRFRMKISIKGFIQDLKNVDGSDSPLFSI